MDEEFLLGEQLLCPRVSAITAEASMLFGMLNSFQYVRHRAHGLYPSSCFASLVLVARPSKFVVNFT
jgi:hypothetical protein